MKLITNIAVITLLVLGSCTSRLYTGAEYDDLYYLSSDQEVVVTEAPAKNKIVESTLRSEEYYDNIYAADTLVSDEYSGALDYNDVAVNGGNGGSINNYYFDNSYAGRLNRFYGNYFYPYWRDPFYYGFGYPSMSFSFGSPFYYSPFYYDPFYYDPFYYDPFYSSYGGYYGGYYGRYGGYYPYMSSFYSPWYGGWGGYYGYGYNDQYSSVTYGRRERQSTTSTNYNSSMMPNTASSRRDGYVSGGSDANRRPVTGTTSPVAASRRTAPASTGRDNSTDVQSTPRSVRQNPAVSGNRSAGTRSTTTSRPEYNSVNRSYTPSYSNPRTSTRPSYNNSRVVSPGSSTQRSAYPSTRSNTPRSSASSYSSGQTRSVPSYSNQRSTYSMPSRRSVQSGSGYSGSSSSRSTYNYSSGRSSSSYSSGGYSGGSSGFSSGGSSSGSSSSSSSSRGGSSGGRR